MSKPHKLSLKSIVAASVHSSIQRDAEITSLNRAASAEFARASQRQTLKERSKQLSVYLEPSVHDQLRDLAYTERTKIHSLMLEAVDLLFKKRGALSIRQLTARDAN